MYRVLLPIFLFSITAFGAPRPNIILCMADDLGWGSVGYNGEKIIQTPALDRMAKEGIRFDRFYAAAPVCSPTRASCLTGRNPYRTGVFFANVGILRPEENTLAELLQKEGYATGHFGKWHLGTFSKTEKDANRGGAQHPELYNPPTLHGFDTFFSTESKVPTFDPMKRPAQFSPKESLKFGWNALEKDQPFKPYGTAYWLPSEKVKSGLDGNDSRIVMNHALAFIQKNTAQKRPFLAVIWFHAPHLPCVGSPAFTNQYQNQSFKMRQYGAAISAMDAEIGRLQKRLKEWGIAENTMLWFTSDNGPEHNTPGQTGGLREQKRSLHEGGIRVPGLLYWPAIDAPKTIQTPVSTCDYFPTILDLLGIQIPDRPLDGVSILPLLQGKKFTRPTPLYFVSKGQEAAISGNYKYYRRNANTPPELYDLQKDPTESTNLASLFPERLAALQKGFSIWLHGCKESFEGKEYGTLSYDLLKQKWPLKTKKDKVVSFDVEK